MFPQNNQKLLIVSKENVTLFQQKIRQAYLGFVINQYHRKLRKNENEFKQYFYEQFIKQMLQYKEQQTSPEKTQTMELLPDLISQQFEKFFVSGSNLQKPIIQGITTHKSKRGRPLKNKHAQQGLKNWIQSEHRTHFTQEQLQVVFNDQIAQKQQNDEKFKYKKISMKFLLKLLFRNNIKGITITSRTNQQYSVLDEQKSEYMIFQQPASQQLRWFETPIYVPQSNDQCLLKFEQE